MGNNIFFRFSKSKIRGLVDKLSEEFHRVSKRGGIKVFLFYLKEYIFILVHDLPIRFSELIEISNSNGTFAFNKEEFDVIDCLCHLSVD